MVTSKKIFMDCFFTKFSFFRFEQFDIYKKLMSKGLPPKFCVWFMSRDVTMTMYY